MPQSELSIYFPNAKQLAIKFRNEHSETLSFQSPITQKDLDDLRWYIEVYAVEYTGEPDDEEAKRIEAKLSHLGEALFNAVFATAQTQALFHVFQQQAADKLLTIHANAAEILALPWELLRDPHSTFLCQQQPPISIRRYCVVSHSPNFIVHAKPKLRLLFIVSRPSDAGFIDPRLDPQAVMEALAENDIAQIEVEFLRPATLKNLEQRLQNPALPAIDVIHFDGHGDYDETEQQGYLLFENPRGIGHLLSAQQFGAALAAHPIALIVLSACQSAAIGNQPLSSVAAGLTDNGVPTVLAMVYSVLAQTTRQLFAGFYAQLAAGQSVGAALDHARRHMASQNQRGTRRRGTGEFQLTLQDWFVPALYQVGNENTLLGKPAPAHFDNPPSQKAHDLPTLQAAGFFGRSRELWQIERWLVQGVKRITITGFGGQGKTYCAIEAAQWLLRTDWFDAVCFVDFSRYQGLDALRYAMNALGVLLDTTLLDETAVPPLLRTRRVLWVWDNLESLAAEILDELLTIAVRWSAHCRFLFTTRQHRFTQPDYADSSQHRYLDLAGLAEPDALAYFNRLWQTAPPPEQPYPARYELMALFGKIAFHPLSIGLLAQQLKTRTIAELGERLEALLLCEPEGGENKSLLASLKLSLERLPPEQRELVKRLGVFQGGAFEDKILEIAEIITNEWTILRSALENMGLIQVENLSHLGIHSYIKFHPTLASALWQELTIVQQNELVLCYQQEYCQLSGLLYYQDDENPHIARATALRELPNLLYAVHIALQADEFFAVASVASVNRFLNYFGLQRDRAALTDKSQDAKSEVGSESWYLARSNQGEQLFDEREFDKATQVFQEIYYYLNLVDKPSPELYIKLGWLSRCFKEQGKSDKAIEGYLQGLKIAKQFELSIEQQRHIVVFHLNLADAFISNGDYQKAKYHCEKASDIIENIDDKSTRYEAVLNSRLGELAVAQKDLNEGIQRFKTALEIFGLLNEPREVANAYHQIGVIYQEAKEWTLAEEAYRNSARIEETLGNSVSALITLGNLATIARLQDKLDLAENWYRKIIKIQQKGNPKDLAITLFNLASLLQTQVSRLKEAQALIDEILAICKSLEKCDAEIWKFYDLSAKIADKQHNNIQAKFYRKLSRDSYLHFGGMLHQMQKHKHLICFVLAALENTEYRKNLERDLQRTPEFKQNFANIIQQILNGNRNEAILLEPLNYTDAAIIHLILKGIANPESLETLFNA